MEQINLGVTETSVEDKANIISDICGALTANKPLAAEEILRTQYPFTALSKVGRRYSPKQSMLIFVRDGFLDRYSGKRLIFPGTLRLISRSLPIAFPYHPNWKMDACHYAFWELFPTIDHIQPIARGGADNDANWITTCQLRNSAKANFTIDELGWTIWPSGDTQNWDGLTRWFLNAIDKDRSLLADSYLKSWHAAAYQWLNSILPPA